MKDELKRLSWPLIVGLGVFAFIRPLMNIIGWMEQLGKPVTPVLVTIGITLVWIAVVVWRKEAQPLLTLMCAGLVYGILAVVLSGILSPILKGELQGPLATPGGFGILSTLVTNVLWGALAGALALVVNRLTITSRR